MAAQFGDAQSFTVASVTTDDVTRVEAHGEVDIATAPQLQASLAEALATDVDQIVLDLSQVSFIDSTGIRVLVAGAQGTDRLRIISSPAVMRVVEIAGLHEHLPLA